MREFGCEMGNEGCRGGDLLEVGGIVVERGLVFCVKLGMVVLKGLMLVGEVLVVLESKGNKGLFECRWSFYYVGKL